MTHTALALEIKLLDKALTFDGANVSTAIRFLMASPHLTSPTLSPNRALLLLLLLALLGGCRSERVAFQFHLVSAGASFSTAQIPLLRRPMVLNSL